MAEQRPGEAPGGASDADRGGQRSRLSALLADLVAAPPKHPAGGWGVALREGAVVGRFEILRELGRGGFGVVYEAYDPELGRKVAIKALRPVRRRLDDAERQRLREEAEAVAALAHPGIVTLYDAGTCEWGPYLVLELLRGEPLDVRLARGALTLREALQLATGVARPLASAHGRRVLHLDLKPANVFLSEDGRVKLLDFGLARLLGNLGSAAGPHGGTPAYAAPEQARGEPVDARTDVFAFGVLLHEALAGALPYEVREGRSGVLDGEVPARLPASVPGAVASLVERCLSRDPAGRPPSGEAVLEELLALERGPAPERAGAALAPETGGSTPEVPLAASRGERQPRRLPWRTRALRSPLTWGGAALLIAMVAVATILFSRGGAAVDSLAVLPLANLTGDEKVDYLADGVTESLIDSLSQLPRLRVMARSTVFTYKGKGVAPLDVGHDLKVDAVLTGQVKEMGGVLAIGMELVKVADGSQLWGEQSTWKLSDVLAMQGEMAGRVSEKLRFRLSGEQRQRLTRRPTESTEAYLLYLRGRSYALGSWTADGFRKGIDYLTRATKLDPTYALAYAGLASTYYDASGVSLRPDEAMAKSRAAASRALALDEELAEAHAALAQVMAQYEWNWRDAEKHYQRALQLNPNLAPAHLYYGFYLAHQGRLAAGIEEMRQAQSLDPLTTFTSMSLAHYQYVARQPDAAIALCRKIIEADPGFFMTHSVLGLAYLHKGMVEEAMSAFNEAKRLDPQQPFTLGYLGHVLAVSGQGDEARRVVEEMKRRMPRAYVDPFAIAIVYAGLGEKDQAFAWLEKAYQARSESLLYYKDAPLLDGLRSDQRFASLLQRMGLAQRPAP